ncbi:MAG: C4-dicarboxylate TRAP transporter substrate-binding protein [Pseudomonadota bacterium]
MRWRAATLVAALLLGFPSSSSQAQTYTVNLVAGHPSVFLWVQHLTKSFIPAVDAALDGTSYAIDWNEFYGGQLASIGGELEALEVGLADVGLVAIAFEQSNLPLQNITFVTPFGSPSPETVLSVMDDMHDRVPGMVESWHAYDLEYLGGGFVLDDYFLMTRFPVNSLDDLRGRRIGAPGPAVNWVQGTGAVGVSSNLNNYYHEIQTGVYDGAIVFATAAIAARLHEVAPYITITNFGAQYGGPIVANRLWFGSVPEEIQSALRKGAATYASAFIAEQSEHIEIALQAMIDGGAIVSELPTADRETWANALPNVPLLWADNADRRGLPASELLGAYMDALRADGFAPMRHWDRE